MCGLEDFLLLTLLTRKGVEKLAMSGGIPHLYEMWGTLGHPSGSIRFRAAFF